MTAVDIREEYRVSRVVATYNKSAATLTCAICGEGLPVVGHPPQFVVMKHYLSRAIEAVMRRSGKPYRNLPVRPFDAGRHDDDDAYQMGKDSYVELVDYDPLIYIVEIPAGRCYAMAQFLADGQAI